MSTNWSQWLDFDRANVEAVPELPGACVIHANMKILYVGGGYNIRQNLLGRLSDPCTSKAKRFRYILTSEFENTKEQQIKEYVTRHGKLPPCMEQDAQ